MNLDNMELIWILAVLGAIGSVVKSDDITVASSSIEVPVSPVFVTSGGAVDIACTADNPSLEVSWSRDGDSKPITSGLSESILHLEEVTQAMTYVCTAETPLGFESKSVKIVVQENGTAPYFLHIPSSPVLVSPGDNFNLTCIGGGNPLPVVKWSRDRLTPIVEGVGESTLQLVDIVASTAFTCLLLSGTGQANQSVDVIVEHEYTTGGEEQITTEAFLEWATKESTNIEPSSTDPELTKAAGSESTTTDNLALYADGDTATSIPEDPTTTENKSTQSIDNMSPAKIVNPPSSKPVLSERSALFVCEVTGVPEPELFWIINDSPLMFDRGRFAIKRFPFGIVLIIDNVRYRVDDGTSLECVADNGIGVTSRSSSRLQVVSSRKASSIPNGFPIILDLPERQLVAEAGPLSIDCPTSGQPPLTFRWFKNNLPLYQDQERIHISKTGSLFFNETQLSDSGVYRCSVENSLGISYSTAVNVTIGNPPRISVGPKDQKFIQGTSCSFYCEAIGVPTPDIKWKKDGLSTDNFKRYMVTKTDHGSVLEIRNMSHLTEHGHDITCHAENGLGAYVSAPARIEIYDPAEVPECFPRVTSRPLSMVVSQSEGTTLRCTVSGSPEPKVEWLKDSVPVNMTSPRYATSRTGSLTIHTVYKADQGWYGCVAENSVGTAYSERAYLYVQVDVEHPNIISMPDDPVMVPWGRDANLTCIAIGWPLPYVKWSTGNTQLTDPFNIPVGTGIVDVLHVIDVGEYVCTAYSHVGQVSKSIRVIPDDYNDNDYHDSEY